MGIYSQSLLDHQYGVAYRPRRPCEMLIGKEGEHPTQVSLLPAAIRIPHTWNPVPRPQTKNPNLNLKLNAKNLDKAWRRKGKTTSYIMRLHTLKWGRLKNNC